MSDDTVWLTGSDRDSDVYHTDADCAALNAASCVDDRERDEVDELRECSKCSGEAERRTDPTFGLAKRLVEADPDDLGRGLATDGGGR